MRFQPLTETPSTEAVRAAWHRFVETGSIDPAAVRPPVARAWQRSLGAGCHPRKARADVLDPAGTMALLRQSSRLIDLATPFLGALSRAAGSERHAAMLGDAQGRVLRIIGDEATMADEGFPRAGSLLSEPVAGANGIGTALAERSYVELVGPEHYIEGFHVFTCQGVPLLGLDGQAAGVMSMSVRREETAGKVRDILFCASEAAECELLAQRLSDTLAETGPLEHVLEGLRQDVVQRIAMARLKFEVAARQIGQGMGASETLRAAQQLIGKFRRQASVWRNLAGHGVNAPEPIGLADLVEDMINLLDTEARVARLVFKRGRQDAGLVLDDVQTLSQRLLNAFLNAMQQAEPGSTVEVDVSVGDRWATVTLTTDAVGGRRSLERVASGLLT